MNGHVDLGFVAGARFGAFDLADNRHAFNNVSEYDMFAIQMRCSLARNKELTAVRVGSGCESNC
mgnify:CR=1 FL=1